VFDMRNLSYPEAALALIAIATASGLSYAAWFDPALAQIERDRQATRAILFELAASRADHPDAARDQVGAPIASKPEPVIEPPEPPKRHPRATTRPKTKRTNELELDDGADPIADLD